GPRSVRSCSVWPTSTCTRVASTNGTVPPPLRSHVPAVCTPRVSTVLSCATTWRTHYCQISLYVGRNCRVCCWRASATARTRVVPVRTRGAEEDRPLRRRPCQDF